MARAFGCTLLIMALLHVPVLGLSLPGRSLTPGEFSDGRLLKDKGQDKKDQQDTEALIGRGLLDESQRTPSKRRKALAGNLFQHDILQHDDQVATHDSSLPAIVGRKRRQNPKLPSSASDETPHLQQTICAQRQTPANPTVVAGIVGGALALFLVVVLTIIYCSYKNHPPSDVRKRTAELHTYLGEAEDVWVGVIPDMDFSYGNVKYDGYETNDKVLSKVNEPL